MNVLITGGTGFVGKASARDIRIDGNMKVVAAVRNVSNQFPTGVEQVVVGDLLANTDYSHALKNVEVVIHAAARVHVMQDNAANPLAEFRKVNVDGTLNLARQTVEAGAKRFIFISSIKVNGESTLEDRPFNPDDTYITTDPYGASKREAEQGLLALAEETGLEVVIIRPPLIYGPGVKANFRSLLKWMSRGMPLPFGAVHNKRSFVAIDNLVSFIRLCVDHPKAANEIFLISDGEDVSTAMLLRKIAKAFGRKAMLLPIPVGLMQFMANVIGKGDVANRLFGSLQVDSAKARNLLGWKPVVTMDEQLKKTAEAYLHETNL